MELQKMGTLSSCMTKLLVLSVQMCISVVKVSLCLLEVLLGVIGYLLGKFLKVFILHLYV